MIPFFLVIAKAMLIVIALLFLVSGLDDFFIDLYYMRRSLARRILGKRERPSLSEEELLRAAEKPTAVMVPAWHESAVIRSMLEDNLKKIKYSNFHFFIGTYPNDPETQREVKSVEQQSKRVHRVVCPHDGPTNKSDCLNWVLQGIRRFERQKKIHFEILVLSDSEDVSHPLALTLFNYLIPEFDMVQLPVIPLEPPWHRLVCGHYLDEFAEFHSKDILVRQYLTGSIPSAGVGTGFSRRAVDVLARDRKNEIFNIRSLTEDYDLGLTLPKYGLKQIFIKHSIDRAVPQGGSWTSRLGAAQKEYIGIREFFPAEFWASVRQKTRWVIGICFQGWESLGWFGNFWNRYFLFRDRKALWNNPAGAACYALLGIEVFFRLRSQLTPESYQYPTLVPSESWLWYVIVVDTFFLLERLGQRMFWVYQFYGWKQSFLAVPRLLVSNVVNFTATARAIKTYAWQLRTGKRIGWDKTEHVYPTA